MNIWSIQLVESPPFERPHQIGSVVHVEIDEESSPNVTARFWRNEFQGMDWMQDPPILEGRQGVPTELSVEIARPILEAVRSVNVRLAARGDYGHIHPTKYRLTIQSALNICSLEWMDELPSEWSQLEQVVQAMKAIGSGLARNA